MTGKPCLSLRVKIIGLYSFTGQGYYTQERYIRKLAGMRERENRIWHQEPQKIYMGGGESHQDFLTIWPMPRCHGHGQKMFDHDHGRNFKVFVVKWSKILTMAKIQIYHGHYIHLTMTIGKILGCY